MSVLNTPQYAAEARTPIDSDVLLLKGVIDDLGIVEQESSAEALGFTSPTYQSEVKSAYSKGKSGIPPFAIAAKLHGIATMTGLAFKPTKATTILDVLDIRDLGRIIGQDGKYISAWLSGAGSVMVDYAKDPVYGEANFNDYTNSTIVFLFRAGFGDKTIRFISQPILKDLVKANERADRTIGLEEWELDLSDWQRRARAKSETYKALYALLQKHGSKTIQIGAASMPVSKLIAGHKRGKAFLDQMDGLKSHVGFLLNSPARLKAMFQTYMAKGGNITALTDPQDLIDQLAILATYDTLQPYVQALQTINGASNVDKATQFSSIEELVIDHNKQVELTLGNTLFANSTLASYLTNSSLLHLYNNSRANVLKIAGELFFEFDPVLQAEIMNDLRKLGLAKSADAAKHYRTLAQKYKMSAIHANSALGSSENGYKTHILGKESTASQFMALRKLLDGDTELARRYKDSPIFKIIKPQYSETLGGNILVADYVKSIDENAKDDIIRDWEIMANDDTRFDAAGIATTVADFAYDLASYAIWQSGYVTGSGTFHNYIPVQILRALDVAKVSTYDAAGAAEMPLETSGILEQMTGNNAMVPPISLTMYTDRSEEDIEAAAQVGGSASRFVEVPVARKIQFQQFDSSYGHLANVPDLIQFMPVGTKTNMTKNGNPVSFDPMQKLLTGAKLVDGKVALQFKPLIKVWVGKKGEGQYVIYRYAGASVIEEGSGEDVTYRAEPIYVLTEAAGVNQQYEKWTEFKGVGHKSIFPKNNMPHESVTFNRTQLLDAIAVAANKPGVTDSVRARYASIINALTTWPDEATGAFNINGLRQNELWTILRAIHTGKSLDSTERGNDLMVKFATKAAASTRLLSGDPTLKLNAGPVFNNHVDITTERDSSYPIPISNIVSLLTSDDLGEIDDEMDFEESVAVSEGGVVASSVRDNVVAGLGRYIGADQFNEDLSTVPTITKDNEGRVVLNYNPNDAVLASSPSPALVAAISAITGDVNGAYDVALSIVDGGSNDLARQLYDTFGLNRRAIKDLLGKEVAKTGAAQLRVKLSNHIPLTSAGAQVSAADVATIIAEAQREIKLDHTTHSYQDPTGRKLIGVSEGKGLSGFGYEEGKLNELQQATKNYYTTRGTLVHTVLERFIKGQAIADADLSATSLDGKTTISIDRQVANDLCVAVANSLANSGINLADCDVHSEFPMADMPFDSGMVGTIDLFLVNRRTGEKILLDWKTKDAGVGFANYNTPWYLGESQRSGYDLQSAAYTYLLNKNGIPVDRRGVVLINVDMAGNQIVGASLDNVFTQTGIDWFMLEEGLQINSIVDKLVSRVKDATNQPGDVSVNKLDLPAHVKRMIGYLEGRIRQLKSAAKITGMTQDVEYTINRLQQLIDGMKNGTPEMVVLGTMQQVKRDVEEAIEVLKQAQADNGNVSAAELTKITSMVEANSEIIAELREVILAKDSQLSMTMSTETKSEFFHYADKHTLELARVKSIVDSITATYTEQKMRALAQEAGVDQFITSFNWNQTAKDVNWLFRYFGSVRHSSDSLSKAVHYMVVNQLNKSSYETYNVGMNVVNAYKRAQATGRLDMKDFMEEIGGVYTGRFVSDSVVAKAQQDYEEFMTKLREKYKLREGESWIQNKQLRDEYNKEVEDWFDGHAERYFSKAYYKLYNEISPQAKREMNQINSMISSITQRTKYRVAVGDKSYFDPALLSTEDKAAYEDLLISKRELSSLYDKYGVEKTGTAREVAQQWAKYNAGIHDLMATTKNKAAWAKARADYAAKHTAAEVAEWDEVNTTEVIVDANGKDASDYFWNDVDDLRRKHITNPAAKARYEELQKKLRALRKIYVNPVTGRVAPGFAEGAAQTFKNIEEEMGAIWKSYAVFIDDTIYRKEFEDVAEAVTDPEYKRKLKYAEDEAKAGRPEVLRDFLERNTIGKNKNHPIRIWTKLVPAKNSKYHLAKEPSSAWSEDDADSPLLNPNYGERTDGKFWKPKASVYDIKNFPELLAKKKRIEATPEVAEFFELLKQTMKDAENMIPFLNREGINMLPMIKKSGWERAKMKNGMFKSLGLGVANELWRTSEDDDQYIREPMRRGLSGTKSMSIPVWYVNKLDDMGELSEDLASTVIQFYQMAAQYKHLSEIKADVDLVIDRMAARDVTVRNKTKLGVETGVYDQIMKFLEMNMFGQRINETGAGKKIAKSKVLDSIIAWTRVNGLAFNMFTMAANWGTAKVQSHIEALLGRYYGTDDYKWAVGEMTRSLPADVSDVMRADFAHKSKVMGMFDLFGMGQAKFKHVGMHYSARVNPMNKLLWGGYSMGDFHSKGTVALAVMHNWRIVNGKPMSKRQFLATISDRKAALGAWNSYETLWDCFEMVDGTFSVKEAFKDIITPTVISNVNNEIRTIATDIDGQLTTTDKAAVSQNVWGKFLVTFRGWLQNAVQVRLKSKGENWMIGDMDNGQYNVSAKFIAECFMSLRHGMDATKLWYNHWDKLDDYEKRHVKKTALELVNIGVLSLILFMFLGGEPPRKNDPWLSKAAKYMILRLLGESVAPYNPMEVAAILNSPTAAKPLLDNMSASFNVLAFFSDEQIRQGPYKGWNKGAKALFKLGPWKNIYEAQSIETKYRYLMNQIKVF